MRDFFDEDFPLSAKQEEELKKQQELEAEKAAENDIVAKEEDPEPIDEGFTVSPEVEFADSDEPCEIYYAGMSETKEIFDTLTQDEPEISESVKEPETAENDPVEEVIEHDPMDSAPIFDLELDEPLDDGFISDAPIIIPDEAVEEPVPAEEDDDLSAELKSLTEKLDNMERAVNAMSVSADSDDDSADFTYEYDERYFAEDETTAYKHPELVKKTGKTSANAAKPSKHDLTINLKTLAKVGAVVAGTVVAAKLLSDDKKK